MSASPPKADIGTAVPNSLFVENNHEEKTQDFVGFNG